MYPFSRFASVCALVLLLAACAGTPRRDVPPDAARIAEALYRDGDFAQAAAAFADAAAASRARRNYYQLRAAEAWRELGDLEAAAGVLDGVGRRRLNEIESLRLDLLLAELALREGDAEAAQHLLTRPQDSVPDAFRARWHDLGARAWREDDPFTAAAELAWLQPFLLAAERPDNLRAIDALLVRVPDAVLQRRSAALPPEHPLYRHAGRALSMRGLPLPRPDDRTIGWEPIGSGVAADLDGYAPPARVALLLPESGPLAAAGRAVREGFLAAYFEEQRPRPELLLFDTGGTVEDALLAYREAVAAGVDAVVGPLSRDSVGALFEQGLVTVPVLALNRSTGAPPPPGSLTYALTPEEEAIAAAERLAHGGARRVVAIIANGDNGSRALSAFRARFEALGGALVSEARIGSDPQYGAVLDAAFAAAGQVSEEGVDADGNPTLLQRYDVDALFLAVEPEQARLLLPQLRILGLTDLPMVATSAIHAVAGNAQLDRELDGVIAAEVAWLLAPQRGIPDHATVAGELPFANGPAARLIAFGIDAFRLLAWLQYLSENPDAQLQGATGLLRIDGFGRVLRDPGWGEFRNGQLRALRPRAVESGAP